MAHTDQLVNYFAAAKGTNSDWIGSEVETFFVNDDAGAISIAQSQGILRRLVTTGWEITGHKGELLTEVRKGTSKLLYELGYPNIELATCAYERRDIVSRTRVLLEELYAAAATCGAYPLFAPMFPGDGNYLAMPDKRDETWLELDGKKALSPLARISAVQFTINVPLGDAVELLNRLLVKRDTFLRSYPQDRVWREYVGTSPARYRADRYGGPGTFKSLEHYCEELSRHAVVRGNVLVPFDQADLSDNSDISLFIRSVWWYFRLRRYGQNLCIEVRPLPRRRDEELEAQLSQVMESLA